MPRRPKPPPEPARPPRRKRNTGSIVARKSGELVARLPADAQGRRQSRTFPPGAWAEASAWLDAALAARAAPAAETTTAPVTLREWAGVWWQTYVEPMRAPNTARWYRYALRLLLPLYPLLLADIRPSQLQAIVGAVSATLDAATVQAAVGVWRRMFDAAVDDELIARNPARRLTLPKTLRKPPARHITDKEVAVLRAAIVGHRFEAAYALILGCGLRIGEILGLHWRDVDLAGARAWIGPQHTNGHWQPHPKARNPHWVPLPPFVVAALIRHRDRQPEGTLLVMQAPHAAYGRRRKAPTGPVPWTAKSVNADLAKLCREHGLDHLTSHAGRHGLATYLMAAGVPAPVIAERLGNTAGVILDVYGHATPAGRDHAGELIDQYLGGEGTDETG